MLKDYPIVWNGKTVGKAYIERQGMFWLIQCRCSLGIQEPLRIIVISDTQQIDLGICVSYQGGCGLQGRVAANDLPLDALSFRVEPVNSGRFIPIREKEPFPVIHKLASAHFEIIDGEAGICIHDERLISNPTGQWSEPITSL